MISSLLMYLYPVRDYVLTVVLMTVSSRTPVPLQSVKRIPCNHRGTMVSFHKRRLLCKDCHSSFYEAPYWIHSSLRTTQALFDSILLDLFQPLSSPILPGATTFRKALAVCLSVHPFRPPQSFPRLSVLMNSRETAVYGALSITVGIAINITVPCLMMTPIPSLTSWIRSPAST